MPYIYGELELNTLDIAIQQEQFTGVLSTPNENLRWIDGKYIKTSHLITSGYQMHTRDQGWNTGTIFQEENLYKVGWDRDIQFKVDRADITETDPQLQAAEVSGAFLRDQAGPEVDAFRISTLASYAEKNGNIASGDIDPDNVFENINNAIRPLRKYGTGNIVLFVSSETMDAIELSPKASLSRDITNGPAMLDTRVTGINGVPFIEVWDERRFANKYEWTDGFIPSKGNQKINILAVARSAIITPIKFNIVKFWSADEVQAFDGYLYQNRLYHDIFMLNSRKDGVFVHLSNDNVVAEKIEMKHTA